MCGNHDEEDVREEEDEALDDEDEEEDEEEEVTVRRPVVMQIEDKIALRAIVAADPLVCVCARVSARVCMRVCECECLWVCFGFCTSVSASAAASVCTRKFVLCVHAQVCALLGLISHLFLLWTCGRTSASLRASPCAPGLMTLNATPCPFLATPAATLATGGCASTTVTVTRFNRGAINGRALRS